MLGDVVARMLVDRNHADESCIAEGEICSSRELSLSLPNYVDVCCEDDELSNCGRGEEQWCGNYYAMKNNSLLGEYGLLLIT